MIRDLVRAWEEAEAKGDDVEARWLLGCLWDATVAKEFRVPLAAVRRGDAPPQETALEAVS